MSETMSETTAETTESQELQDFKAKLWHTVMDKKREHDWCSDAEELLIGRLGVQDPSPPKEDIFPHGTIIAYEGTTYMAHKNFDGHWEYGGSGAAEKGYGDYQELIQWFREMGTKPRVVRYGLSFGHRNSGRYYDMCVNALVESV